MSIKYKYESYGTGVFRPVISVGLISRKNSITYSALVDSGSDFCLFDASIAEVLEIELEKGMKSEAYGIAGEGKTIYIHTIGLSLGSISYQAKVGFLTEMNQGTYGILGQVGFFDKFKITFDYNEKTIELEEKKKRARSFFFRAIIDDNEKKVVQKKI